MTHEIQSPDTVHSQVRHIELRPGIDLYLIIAFKADGCASRIEASGSRIGADLRVLAEKICGAINEAMGGKSP